GGPRIAPPRCAGCGTRARRGSRGPTRTSPTSRAARTRIISWSWRSPAPAGTSWWRGSPTRSGRLASSTILRRRPRRGAALCVSSGTAAASSCSADGSVRLEKLYLAGVLDVRTGTLHTTGLAHKGAALFCTLLRNLAVSYGPEVRRIHARAAIATSEVGAPP